MINSQSYKNNKLNRSLITLLKRFWFVIFILLLVNWTNKPLFKSGIWHAVIQRTDGQQIVFNFESKTVNGRQVLYVLNAKEHLLVDSIQSQGDSVFIQMPFFESGFRCKIKDDGNLEGIWIKRLADKDQVMPFKAIYNQKQRFAVNARPKASVSGRWAVNFKDGKNEENAVGEFNQQGNYVSGTFLTVSGDYRYLEGVVNGDSLKLSGFDGGHAYLFTAKIVNDTVLSNGSFYSGATGYESWTAKKDSNASLPDGYEQTHLRTGESKLNFKFKSIDGNEVSLSDPRFKNKVVIIQIMGSWCPNCMDETKFLSDYYRKNRDKGIEVIALAYERSTDFDRSKASLLKFKQRFDVQYPILVTGVTVSDPLRTEKTLPQLDKIDAFPTSIFIGKMGDVKKIYTGFSGPGTGEHYDEFKKEFDETIHTLLNE
jgi:thiol-disulfide isomerase/thioredoxin